MRSRVLTLLLPELRAGVPNSMTHKRVLTLGYFSTKVRSQDSQWAGPGGWEAGNHFLSSKQPILQHSVRTSRKVPPPPNPLLALTGYRAQQVVSKAQRKRTFLSLTQNPLWSEGSGQGVLKSGSPVALTDSCYPGLPDTSCPLPPDHPPLPQPPRDNVGRQKASTSPWTPPC